MSSAPSSTTSAPSTAMRANSSAVPSIISADLKIIGNMQSSGDIQVDGQVEGDVLSRTLTVGEGASVKGSVRGETVRICGEVHGEVSASSVIIAKTARVSGDVVHQSLAIEAGAYLEGSIKRMEANRAASVPISGAAPVLKPGDHGSHDKTGTGGRNA
jgi:cytoskeletal protein CcmA (bactofilin family)